MANILDIRRRIRSVVNTRQITKAMKVVSAAKLRRAQERTMAAREKAKLTTLTEAGSRVSMDVPAQAAHYICTCDNPMEYNGRIIISEDLVREKKLLPEAQIRPR